MAHEDFTFDARYVRSHEQLGRGIRRAEFSSRHDPWSRMAREGQCWSPQDTHSQGAAGTRAGCSSRHAPCARIARMRCSHMWNLRLAHGTFAVTTSQDAAYATGRVGSSHGCHPPVRAVGELSTSERNGWHLW